MEELSEFVLGMYKTTKGKFEKELKAVEESRRGVFIFPHSKYEAELGRVGETLRKYNTVLEALESDYQIPEELKPSELRESIDDVLLNPKGPVYLTNLKDDDEEDYVPYDV